MGYWRFKKSGRTENWGSRSSVAGDHVLTVKTVEQMVKWARRESGRSEESGRQLDGAREHGNLGEHRESGDPRVRRESERALETRRARPP